MASGIRSVFASMRKFLIILTAGTILSSCTQEFKPGPDVVLEPNYKHQAAKLRGETVHPYTRWWANFGDPNLNRLIEEALAQNLSIEQARQRIRSARFNSRIVKSTYLPQLEAEGAGTISGTKTEVPGAGRVTNNTSNFSKSLSGAWKIDFLGSKASAQQQAAIIEAQKEALNAARLDVIAATAVAYLNAQGFGRQLEIARKSLSVQANTADITRAKLEAGSASALDSTRASAAVNLTAADIPALQQAREESMHQIAVLLGREPASLDNIFSRYKPIRRPKVKFSEGIPADLLRNRPDVRAAEWALRAAVAQIGVAEADLYPSITLSGTLRAQVHSGNETVSWGFGPSVNIPIFDRGRLKATVDLAKSEARVEYLNYRQVVLQAVREVEDALVALRSEAQRQAKLQVAVQELRRAEELARQLNEAGTTEFSDVLDAQASLYSAELRLAIASQQLALNYVELCRALGGGWAGDEPVMTEDTLKLAKKS